MSRLRIAWLFAAILVAMGVGACTQERKATEQRRLGLLLYADHTAINASRDGFLAYVHEHPDVFGPNPEVVVRNVGGDPTKLAAYADYFSTEKFDLVAALGTPCAKVLTERNHQNRAVFGAPPDAIAAGIVTDVQHPGGMTTGVTYRPPVGKIIEVIRIVFPAARRIGVLHNPAEANSRLVVDEFARKAAAAGLVVVTKPVNDPSEVATALDAIVGDVDLVFTPNDNTVHAAFSAIVERAGDRRVPIVSVDRGSVVAGAVVGVGGDYFEIGRIMAELGAKLVKGADPGTTPIVEAAEATRIYLNQREADKLGVRIPSEFAAQVESVQ